MVAAFRSETIELGVGGGSGALIALNAGDLSGMSFADISSLPADALKVPSLPTHAKAAVNKEYVDAMSTGLDLKESVLLVSDQNLMDVRNGVSGGSGAYDPVGGASGRGQLTATLTVSDTFTLDGVQLSSSNNGARILAKNEGDSPFTVAEVSSVDCVADVSDSLDGTYFVIYGSPNQAFVVWYSTSGGSAVYPDPTPPSNVTYNEVQVDIDTNETAADVSNKTRNAIQSHSLGSLYFTIVRVLEALTITNVFDGDVTAVADGATGTGFTFGTDTAGTGLGPAANGIWTLTISGTDLTLDRATDFDTDAKVTAGAFCFSVEGNQGADTGWVLATNDPIVIGGGGGSALSFVQFSAAGVLTAGYGLGQAGNELYVDTFTLAGGGLSGGFETPLAVKAGDGIVLGGAGSDFVTVDLANNPGMEFSGGQLIAKVDGTQGVVINGASGIAIKPAKDESINFAAGGGLSVELAGTGGIEHVDQGGGESAIGLKTPAASALVVDASGVAVSRDTVGGANLSTSIDVNTNGLAVRVDDTTVEEGTSGQLRVKDDGITAAKLNVDTAGAGIIQNGGTGALEVNTDTGGANPDLTITTDQLLLNKRTTGNGGSAIASSANGIFVNTDDSTIELDSATDKVRVKDDGVTAAKINSDVAGNGIIQNGGTGALDADFGAIGTASKVIEGDKFLVDQQNVGPVTSHTFTHNLGAATYIAFCTVNANINVWESTHGVNAVTFTFSASFTGAVDILVLDLS